MANVPDFTATELNTAEGAVRQHYGHSGNIELADSELRLDPTRSDTTVCPTLYWGDGECTFVVFKTAESRYRGQFFYRPDEQQRTGTTEYEDLGDCITELFRVQAEGTAGPKSAY